MRNFFTKFISIFLLISFLGGVKAWGQTNPTVFDLSGGNFSFTSQTASSTTYPTNIQGWNTGGSTITTAHSTSSSADISLTASATASTIGIGNLGSSGFQFLSSAGSATVGSLALALNTTGRTSVLVTWTAADQTNASGRQTNLTLQYRTSNSGTFTNVSSSTYTTNTGGTTGTQAAQTFTNIALPAACDNQSIVQLRWIYYESASQSGGRDAIRLDDISITSSVASGAPTLTTPTATSITNTSAILGATITADGGTAITARGTSFKTSSPVVATDNQLAEGGTSVAAFSHTRTLSAQTQYFYVGYATANGTSISSEGNFRTLSNPPTGQPASFTTTSGSSSLVATWGTATFPGSGATQGGYVVIYSTGTPTLSSANGVAPAAGVGTLINITPTNLPTTPALTTTINSLTNGTTYNLLIVPYTWDGSNAATYNYLTSGALTTTGTPAGIPTLTTPTATAISNIGATLGATITSNSGATITASGVVYGTSAAPTGNATSTSPLITTNTAFTVPAISSLAAQTQYFYRGFATNAAGTNYSTDGNFRTLSNPPTGQPASFSTTAGSSSLVATWGTASFPASGATQGGYVVIYSTGTPTLSSANGVAPAAGVGTLINITPTILPATPALTTTINSLTNGTTYNLLIVPYTWDGANAATYNYLTASARTTTGTPTAITYTWQGGTSGTWSSSSNWSPNGIPSTGDNVIFNTGGNISVTSVPTVSLGNLTVSTTNTNVTLAPAASTSATITLSNSSTALSIATGTTLNLIGHTSGPATMTIAFSGSGNTASIAGTLRLQTSGTGAGRYTATNSATSVSGIFRVDNSTSVVTSTASNLTIASGGEYNHATDGGSIPTATWATTSTCNVTGVVATVPTVASFAQNFGNVTWNCTGQNTDFSLVGNLQNVSGTLRISSTGAGSNVLRMAINLTQNTTFNIANFYQTGGIFTFMGNGASTFTIGMNVSGNFNIDGGTFNFNQSTNFTTSVNLNGNFSMTGGTIANGGGTIVPAFNFSGTTIYSKTSGSFSGAINFGVNASSSVNFGTSIIDGSTGTFTASSGATIITANTGGFAATGAASGSVQVGGTRTYNAGASYTYNGSTAQVTGTGLPTSAITGTVTINNAAGVTLSQATGFTGAGALTLTNGKLTTNGFVITLANSTAGSTNSYIVTDATGTAIMSAVTTAKTLPIGTSSSYAPLILTAGSSTSFTTYVSTSLPISVSDNNKVVGLAWSINGINAPSSAVFQWNTANEGGTFTSNGTCDLGRTGVSPTTYTVTSLASAAGTNPNTITANSGFASGNNWYVIGNTNSLANVPPSLTAAVGATVDNSFNVTFTEDAMWRAAISSITVGGTTLSNTAYNTTTSGQITFNPANSALLQSAGSKAIVVNAAGYAGATVSQNIGFGAAMQLTNNTAPTAPATNGAVLATQPKVNIADLYGNTVTTSSAVVTVAATQGTWTLGGTLTATASSGVATFSGLTASSAAAVTNASLTFSASGLGTLASGTFNIPAPDFVTISSLGTTVSENFNTLTNTSLASIPGFLLSVNASPTWSNGVQSATQTSGTGNTPTTGGTYTWSAGSGGTDWAVGVMTSGGFSSPNSLMAKYYNNTGATINSLTIGYDCKRFRINSASASVQFFYSTDGTNWTSATGGDIASGSLPTGSSAYNFNPSGTPSSSNAGVVAITNLTINGLNIANGNSVYLRWQLNTTGGSSQALGIDNVSLRACGTLPATSNLTASATQTVTDNGATVTVSSTTLATGNYTVTYNVSGTNTVSSTTATMSFTAGSPGTGTFTTSNLSNGGIANVVNITAMAFTSATSCTSTTSTSTANFSTVTPTATVSNTGFAQFTTQNITRGNNSVPVSRFRVDVTNGAVTLSSISFTTPNNGTTNNYVGGTDINNFKVWYGTSTDFNSASQLGTQQTAVNNNPSAGETVSFSSINTSLAVNTYYFWITADVLGTATSGRTLTVNAPSISLSTGTNAGSSSATSTQTINAVPVNYYLNGTNSITAASSYWTGANGTGAQLGSLNTTDLNLNIASAVSTSGDFTLSTGSKFIINNGGNLTIANGHTITGTIDVDNGGTLTINSTSIPSLGTLGSSSSTIIFGASAAQTISNKTYAHLTIGGTSAKTIGTASVNGTFTRTGSASVAGSSPTYGASSTLAYVDATNGQAYTTGLEWPSISGPTNVTVNLSGTGSTSVSLPGSTSRTISGALTLTAGTLSVGANTLTLAGTVSGAGTIDASSTGSTVAFTGAGFTSFPSQLNFPVNGITINNGNTFDLGGSRTIGTAGGALTLTSGKLNIGDNTLTLAGTVSGMSASNCLITNTPTTKSNLNITGNLGGSVFFDNTSDANRSSLNGTNALNNLSIGASGNLVLGNKVNLFGTLIVGTGSTLNSGDGLLVLRNTSSSTARLATVSGTPTFTGTVIVENYINNQNRGWRLMGSPLTSAGTGGIVTPSVQSNWQSNFGYTVNPTYVNYGTNFYSPTGGLGMDGTTNRHSLLRFWADTLTVGGWTNINTTGVNLFNADPQSTGASSNPVFFAFVRGDKSVVAVPNAGTPNSFQPTTLAAKGRITYGTRTISLNGMNNGYAAFVNPHLSPIDLTNGGVTFSSGLTGTIYCWNPRLNSNVGGWAVMNSTNSFTHNGFDNFMQVGQAALVQFNSASTATVTITEAAKVSNFSQTVTGVGNGLQDNFRTYLKLVNTDGSKVPLDELFVGFKNGYNAGFVSTEDGEKMFNGGENLSSRVGNKLVAVDARPYIQNSDSIFMNFTNTRVANYEFEFDPSNFDASVTSAKLVDKFLNSETPISLSTKTTVPFSVTATAGSNAADRFMVVFNGTGALPNRGFTVSGEKLGTNKVRINWEAVNEFGVKHYELEHSTDGRTFSKINTQVGKNGNVTNNYTYTDNNPTNGVNYYRIKTTQNNDIERYSNIITINLSIGNQQSSMVVYPNPVKGNVIGLQLQDLEKGMYSVRLLSIEGKEVYKQQLQVSGNSLSTTISPSTRLAQGTYTLQVVGKNNSYTQKVVVE